QSSRSRKASARSFASEPSAAPRCEASRLVWCSTTASARRSKSGAACVIWTAVRAQGSGKSVMTGGLQQRSARIPARCSTMQRRSELAVAAWDDEGVLLAANREDTPADQADLGGKYQIVRRVTDGPEHGEVRAVYAPGAFA